MPGHDAFVDKLATFDKDKRNKLGQALYRNAFHNHGVNLDPEFSDYQITCVSAGNSKIFKVEPPGGELPFILKLECWPMDPDARKKFNQHPVLTNAEAEIYYNQPSSFYIGSQLNEMNIQVQPFCKGGTLETAARNDASKTPQERIKEAFKLYDQVADYYIALNEQNILFPDGKPSNFTLDENGHLNLTDMKTYVISTPEQLKYCPQINTPNYPLYIPNRPPRELKAIHARHFGMNLYAYLSGWQFKDFYNNSDWKPKNLKSYPFDNKIFQSFEGKCLANLIKKMMSNDPKQIPDILEAKEILNLIEQGKLNEPETVINLLEKGIIDANDAIAAFPDNEIIISISHQKNPSLIEHAKPSVVNRLANSGKIPFDNAIKAFPADEALILSAHQKDPSLIDRAKPSVVNHLANSGKIPFDDAIKAFPADEALILSAHEKNPSLIQFAKPSVVNDLANSVKIPFDEAIKAFPTDGAIQLTAYCHKIKSALDSDKRQQAISALMEFGQLAKDQDIKQVMNGVAGELFQPKSSDLLRLLADGVIRAQQYTADVASNLSEDNILEQDLLNNKKQSLSDLSVGLNALGSLLPDKFLDNIATQKEEEINNYATEITDNVPLLVFRKILSKPLKKECPFIKQVDEQYNATKISDKIKLSSSP